MDFLPFSIAAVRYADAGFLGHVLLRPVRSLPEFPHVLADRRHDFLFFHG